MPPARDMDREEAYGVLQGELEFHPSMVKPASRPAKPVRTVSVLRYEHSWVTSLHCT